jgi:hypothetical protein
MRNKGKRKVGACRAFNDRSKDWTTRWSSEPRWSFVDFVLKARRAASNCDELGLRWFARPPLRSHQLS